MGERRYGDLTLQASAIAFDPRRLLERENPDASDPGEIRHYIRIYGELIDFKRDLLARASSVVARLSPDARDELSITDVPALREQLDRLQGRLQHWCRRLWEIQGIDMDERQLLVRHAGRAMELTRREFQLLAYLLRHPGRVLTARELVQGAWGCSHLGDGELRAYVTRLRRKMRDVGLPCRLINRPRKGYFVEFD